MSIGDRIEGACIDGAFHSAQSAGEGGAGQKESCLSGRFTKSCPCRVEERRIVGTHRGAQAARLSCRTTRAAHRASACERIALGVGMFAAGRRKPQAGRLRSPRRTSRELWLSRSAVLPSCTLRVWHERHVDKPSRFAWS
jgi:hypothetical protein